MAGRFAALVCVSVVLGVMWVPMAVAETVVSGDRDSNAPLVIDPSTDPDDPLETDITDVVTRVFFVQSMPVTKRVNQVTLGDFARLSGCGSGQALLQVHEHAVGALVGSPTVRYYATSYVTVPTTPAKLTWTFPAFTMRKGYGYTFELERSGCSTFKQTTWAHNDAQVNGGPQKCTAAPQGWKRMWHDLNADDPQSGCSDYPSGSRTFDPSMQSGWLVSQIVFSQWDVRMTSQGPNDPPPVCVTPNPPNTYDAYGAAASYWRTHPGNPFMTDFSCEWAQYANYGIELDHGWYYAQPWLTQRSGAPRDMYLELDTIDYDALLEKYAPTLKFDDDENFYLQDAGAMTNFDDSPPSGYEVDSDYVNVLRDGSDDVLAAAGSPGPGAGAFPPELTLEGLGTTYGFGPGQITSSTADWIDARGSTPLQAQTDSEDMRVLGYDEVMYGRVVYDPNDYKPWLQYWFFYYFNSYENQGLGVHEGDWEMVQVGLDSAHAPQQMTLGVHGYAYKLGWSEMEKAGPSMDSPVVYVAARSHASYPEAGETPIDVENWIDPADDHDGDGLFLRPPLEEISSSTPWTGWRGRWGASRSGFFQSPMNPSEQGERWEGPSTFHLGARDW